MHCLSLPLYLTALSLLYTYACAQVHTNMCAHTHTHTHESMGQKGRIPSSFLTLIPPASETVPGMLSVLTHNNSNSGSLAPSLKYLLVKAIGIC